MSAYQRKKARLTPKPSRLEIAAAKAIGALQRIPSVVTSLVQTAAAGAVAVDQAKAAVSDPAGAIAAAAASQAARAKPKRKRKKKAKAKKRAPSAAA